jgi:hypothetical protein
MFVFLLVFDDILKQLELRGNISTRLKLRSAYSYTDDISSTARTKQKMIDIFEKLKKVSLQFGLRVSENETKYM